MYQGKKQQFDWTFALVATDVFTVAAAFFITPLIMGISGISKTASIPPFHSCFAFYVVILVLLRSFNLYSWSAFTRIVPTIYRLFWTLLFSVGAFALLRFLFGSSEVDFYAHWSLITAVTAGILLVVARSLFKYLVMEVFKVIPVERIAFVGSGMRMALVLKALRGQMGAFQKVVGYFQTGEKRESEEPPSGEYNFLGTPETIEQQLVDNHVSLLVVDQSAVGQQELEKIGEVCARCFINLKIIPNIYELWAATVSIRSVAGTPLMGVYGLQYDRYHNRLAKRAVDIVFAIAGLIVAAPIIGLMAILIRRESPGPIFFRQIRLGQHGKPFHIIKLRSMKLDAEVKTGAIWAVKDDPRRLKIGTFMRKTNIDELPQFWNVLKGDMSMVGPRPERPEFVTDFKHSIRYYNLRHSCKPGVTGWAAVNGLRGDTSLEDRLEYDLYYIENWSILQDIKIIFLTLLPPKNAY